MKTINIAILGFGVVGSGVVSILLQQRKLIGKRRGIDINIKSIVCRDIYKKRDVLVPSSLLSSNVYDVIADPSIDIIVEAIGGDSNFIFNILAEAIRNKKRIVTANKALLATRGKELFDIANNHKLDLLFEASVGGGIPIIQTIRESLVGDNINSIYAIINGTSNYILSKMSFENYSYNNALKKAQNLGFAESDPTLDVNGMDSAHKIAILASFAFNSNISSSFYYEGIQNIDLIDINYARELGFAIKLLAIATNTTSSISVCVHPALVPFHNPLANIHDEYNAILINSQFLGTSIYSGKGAGSFPTANAIIGDIVTVATNIAFNLQFNQYKNIHYEQKSLTPIKDNFYDYYIRFNTLDKYGILSKITNVFAKYKISIAQVIQKGRHKKNFVHLVLSTHKTKESDVLAALNELESLNNIIDKPTKLMRIVK